MKPEFIRFVRRGIRQGTWPLLQRYAAFKRILNLPPIQISQDSDFAVHILTCERDALMLHWAVRSFASHVSEPFQLVIHDDGSCSPNTLKRFSETFLGATVIPRRQACLEVAKHLRGFPNLLETNRNSFASIRWIDFYLLGASKFIIFLDPDVLFFASPTHLFEGSDSALWMRDCFYSLHITQEEANDRFGGITLPQLNGGLGRIPRSCFDPMLASRVLDFMQQSYVGQRAAQLGLPTMDDMPYSAVYSAVYGKCHLLPESYQIGMEPGLQGVIAKHYTTPRRFLFFEEGIPRVAHHLGVSLPPWLRERG
ncbi:MAG TPA: hypothetical protein VJ464_02135 [Blastocatellia bacterium]|nr:hypothetical protein [Blastocatellia bacterium]